VGISGNPAFVDGGALSVPRFAFVDAAGNWAVEGEGVSPDEGFDMLDRPEDIAAGRERMIGKAVEHLLKELEKPQYKRPDRPAAPIRTPGGGR
jgi:tricorn protease